MGKCNRVIKCGYHYPPKQYFIENGIKRIDSRYVKIHKINNSTRIIKNGFSVIPNNIFLESLNLKNNNHFTTFLFDLFQKKITEDLIDKYKIGTSLNWYGATIFWQIDINNCVRTGKKMLYNSESGKRVKTPKNYISWIHKDLRIQNYELRQCFFGEHLLNNNSKTVAIVESEKTAIIASVYLPQFIWLATGGINLLNEEKCSVLKGRKVFFFPDNGAFQIWSRVIGKFTFYNTFIVSDFLEKQEFSLKCNIGFDLADYLVKRDNIYTCALTDFNYPLSWDL